MPSSLRKVKSADRTIDIFEVLSSSALPMSATEISKALGIPKSSLFHLIATLEDRGYVQEITQGHFRIGPRFKEIARAIDGRRSLTDIVRPILEGFSQAINETTGFSVERDDAVEVLATETGRQALTYTMRAGDLAPMYAVSAGKAILSAKTSDWLDAYVARLKLEEFTPNTIRSPERLLQEIERARAEGVSSVNEEFTPGIVGMGACVRAGDHVVGALNVALPTVRATPEHLALVRQQLFSALRRMEESLGAYADPTEAQNTERKTAHSWA